MANYLAPQLPLCYHAAGGQINFPPMTISIAIAIFGGYDLIARSITAKLELIANIVWLQYHTK